MPQTSDAPPAIESLHSVTAVIIARNEEATIVNCIDTLRWCDEILVLDTGSTDRTRGIAQRAGARVEQAKSPFGESVLSRTTARFEQNPMVRDTGLAELAQGEKHRILPNPTGVQQKETHQTGSGGDNFAAWRQEAAELVKTAWIFYIDADERVTPALAHNLLSKLRRTEFDGYTLRRNNIHFGRWMQHGGWDSDMLLRVMKKEKLQGWDGSIHESARVVGRIGSIEEPLVHLTHRSLYDGLRKTIDWTDREAQLFIEANHPPIKLWRLLRIVTTDFIWRMFFELAWKDGIEGSIEAMIQTMNRFIVYVRVWELQQKPPLEKRYQRIEEEIQKQWETNKVSSVKVPQP